VTCYNCTPIHKQLEGHKGRWVCPKTMDERTICETPASSCGDVLAHAKALREARTPKWCPLNRGLRRTRPRA